MFTEDQTAALRAIPPSAARVHPITGDLLVTAGGAHARITAETGTMVCLSAAEFAAGIAEIDATVARLAARAATEAAEIKARADAAAHCRNEVLNLLCRQIPGAERDHLRAIIDRFYGDGLRVTGGELDDGYGDGAFGRFCRLFMSIGQGA